MNARDLTNHLAALLRREHHAMADFLLALADFDRERGWLELGHPSLFSFLHRELGLSKGAAYYRKVGSDLVRNFPEVVAPLRDGRLCITSLVELAKVLTRENRSEILPRFFHRSKQEAKAVSAELRPAEAAPHRDLVTAPARPAEPTLDRAQVTVHPGEPPPAAAPATVTAPSPPIARPRDVAEPLTADLRRLHITVSRRYLAKLDAARDALSHATPSASTEDVLEAALDLLIEARATRKAALVKKPRVAGGPGPTTSSARTTTAPASSRCPPVAGPPAPLPAGSEPGSSPASRYIPATVRREVWSRDRGRCQWPLVSGGVCGSTLRLEFDHVTPRAHGGPSTVANLRLLCRSHNGVAARQALGDEWMDRFTCRGSVVELSGEP